MEKQFEAFTVSILKINKLIQKIKQFEMREYDLKSIHVMCLYFLNDHKGGLTASELMRLTVEDKAAISRALKLLQDNGFVVYDAKTYNAPISLTEKGTCAAQNIMKKADRAVAAGSADFTEDERLLFYKSLANIADNLKNYYEELISS